jgi:hypothetical protein
VSLPGVPGADDRLAQVSGAVSRIAVPGELPAGIAAVAVVAAVAASAATNSATTAASEFSAPGGPGQLLAGDDPGFVVVGHMRAVAVPADLGGLAGVPGLSAYGGDDAILGDLAGRSATARNYVRAVPYTGPR